MLEASMRQGLIDHQQNVFSMPLAPSGRARLEDIFAKAAAQDRAFDAPASPSQQAQTASNVKRLLIEADRLARNSGRKDIDADAIDKALKGLCPLYPIC